jgi:superfamily I DNA/RNA helicase
MEESERENETETDPDAVTLTTVHAAKGLEFPVVLNIAMEQGIFPHERALSENGYDEEKRLFYVAITRAKKELYLLRARYRMHRGVNKPSHPSVFLPLLGEKFAISRQAEDLIKVVDEERMAAKFAELYNLLKS